MKTIALLLLLLIFVLASNAQNVGINTAVPSAYGHGGTNRLLEIKNDAGTGSNFQSHLILSTNGTAGSLGTLTWAALNIPGVEKRTALIGNTFETPNATRLNFYTRNESGLLSEKLTILSNGNIGIGTSTPQAPLGFSTALGQKIVLWDDGTTNSNSYGIGMQSGLLQIHSYSSVDHIAFGFGRSGAFNERMRIINNGSDGLLLNGRIVLRNGTNPLDINASAGIWMYKADNTALVAFMGVQNNQNVGFFGGPAGWGFTYDAINSRVGIGNNNPNAPLAFPPLLGKKITLYPGATGDVGFAVAGNRLQIYSDNPNADVAIGYDQAGVFNERFAVKPNGALALVGNTGAEGQVLKSNGPGAAASWVGKPYVIAFLQSGPAGLPLGGLNTTIPGVNGRSFSLTEASTIVFNADLNAVGGNGIGNIYCRFEVEILNESMQVVASAISHGILSPNRKANMNVVGMGVLSPGNYSTRVILARTAVGDGDASSHAPGKLIIQVFPN